LRLHSFQAQQRFHRHAHRITVPERRAATTFDRVVAALVLSIPPGLMRHPRMDSRVETCASKRADSRPRPDTSSAVPQ
jgi:hypothetical protein